MAAQPSCSYDYAPLQSDRHFRLLQILSGPGEPTRCSLDDFDLLEAPEYECLSYTWDDPIDHALSSPSSRTMTKDLDKYIAHENGSVIKATQNLADALQQLCTNAHKYLWIDAICINQDDIDERGHQVHVMGEIYQRARTVIIWLGHEEENARGSLKVLDRLSRLNLQILDAPMPSYDIDGFRAYEALRVLCEGLGITDLGQQEWLEFAAFLHRKWFGRIWVVQESFFARDRKVLLGSYRLEWSSIMKSAKVLSQTGMDVLLKACYLHAAARGGTYSIGNATAQMPDNRLNNLGIFERMQTLESLDIERCLYYSRFFDATDPHDHVFAILDILLQSQQGKGAAVGIHPDYRTSSEDAYTQATAAAIRETRSLRILGLRDCATSEQLPNLPSWVPDYNNGLLAYPLADDFAIGGKPTQWNASPGTSWTGTPLIEISTRLPVHGFEFDTVEEIGPTFDDVDQELDIEPLLNMLLQYARKVYASGETPCDAFLRTIVKDGFRGVQNKSEICDGFSAFVMIRLWELRDCVDDVDNTEMQHNSLADQLESAEATINRLAVRYPSFPSVRELEEMIRISGNEGSVEEQKLERDRKDFEQSFRVAYFGRRVIRTHKAYFGITAETVEKGDRVWILTGAKAPFVLRTGDNGSWRLVGEAYVHGIMNGEAVSKEDQMQHIHLE
jgi:hypothetical protein